MPNPEHGQEVERLCASGTKRGAKCFRRPRLGPAMTWRLQQSEQHPDLPFYAAQMPEPPGLIQKIAPYAGLRKQLLAWLSFGPSPYL